MTSRIAVAALFLCAVAFCFISCATFPLRSYEGIEQSVRSGKISDGIKNYKKINQSTRNAIQWKMDLALLQHFDGQYEDSIVLLNDVHELMEESVTKSITQGIGVAVLNDNVASYVATAYEYLFVNAFNALNYYRAGDLEEALVEVRRISNKQREYMSKYGDAIKSDAQVAIDKMKSDSTEDAKTLGVNMDAINSKSPPAPTDDVIYRDSSFARYVSMVFRMMSGDEDNARVDASVLASMNPEISIGNELFFDKASGKGRIEFLAFGGLIGKRQEKVLYFPRDFLSLPFIFLRIKDIDIPAFRIKFAYPIYNSNNNINAVASVRVIFSDGSTCNLSLLENFNQALEKDVASKSLSAFTRSVIRSISKKAVAVTAGAVSLYAAKQELAKQKKANRGRSNLSSDLIYALTYGGVVTAIEAVDLSESADVRQCVFLPQASYAGGVTVPAGKYSGKIQFLNVNGNVLYEEHFKDISVENGKTVLMESACLK